MKAHSRIVLKHQVSAYLSQRHKIINIHICSVFHDNTAVNLNIGKEIRSLVVCTSLDGNNTYNHIYLCSKVIQVWISLKIKYCQVHDGICCLKSCYIRLGTYCKTWILRLRST